MLKKIIYISIILTLTLNCGCSKFNVNHGVVLEPLSEEVKREIKILDLEKSTGVIFPKEYEANFNKGRLSNRFTPTENEIREAEIEINKQYLDSDKRFAYNQNFVRFKDDTEWSLEKRQKDFQNLMKWNKKEAKRSIKFDRQYLGFIENGQKILVIQFIDFSQDPYELRNQLTKSWIGGWHGWFETNVRLKEYNMETKRLNSFGWSQL
jgi:hypothetical protein